MRKMAGPSFAPSFAPPVLPVTKLLRRGVAGIASGQCGEGFRRAEGMVNDCRAKLAVLHWDAGKKRLAARLFAEHLKFRRAGVQSVFTKRAVERMLAQVDAA